MRMLVTIRYTRGDTIYRNFETTVTSVRPIKLTDVLRKSLSRFNGRAYYRKAIVVGVTVATWSTSLEKGWIMPELVVIADLNKDELYRMIDLPDNHNNKDK